MARLCPLHGGNIPAAMAAAANIAVLFLYVCTFWSEPKNELVFGSAEALEEIKLSLPG